MKRKAAASRPAVARPRGATIAPITFFEAPAAFRAWLAKHHASAAEVVVGFHKRATGRPSLTWPESVDEALCFGWIDGIRRRLDEERYSIRFTPRRPRSIWSAVNIRRAGELIAAKRMRPAGQAAFEARQENRSGIYAYEQRPRELPEPYVSRMRANRAAWEFFQTQPPWYRRNVTWWVVSAKKEETRQARLETLIADSAAGRTLRRLTRPTR